MAKGEDQGALKAAIELLLRKPSGKGKRTSDRLAAEAQKFFREPRYVQKIPIAPESLDPETLYTYQQLLNSIALHQERLPLLYTDVLMLFLKRLGIAWYQPAFQRDPRSPGSGQRPSVLGGKATKLRAEGKTWSQIAKLLIPREYAKDVKRASDRVRLAASHYRPEAGK